MVRQPSKKGSGRQHPAAGSCFRDSGRRPTSRRSSARESRRRYIGNLRSEIDVSNHTIANLDKKRKEELKDHEKYRDSVMRRAGRTRRTGKQDKFEEARQGRARVLPGPAA